MKERKNFYHRYIVLVGVFALVCLIYIARLVNLQLVGNPYAMTELPDGANSRAVSIPAVRGNLCDRNGKVIATSRYEYDLNLDYDKMPYTMQEANDAILKILEAVYATFCEDKLSENICPFVGTYPDMTFRAEAFDTDSQVYRGIKRIAANNRLSENCDADELLEYFTKRYKLVDSDKNAKYTADEMTALICTRYNMEISGFGYIQPYTLAKNVDISLISYIKEQNIPFADFAMKSERIYNYPGYASHILGSVGKIRSADVEYYTSLGYPMDATVGTSGCEYAFEKYLHGTDGVMIIVEDDNGNIVDSYVEKEPIAGNDVWLTIDIELQMVAEDALKDNIEYIVSHASGVHSGEDADAGAVVAIDPNSGAVLAIASYPTFDLATFNDDYSDLIENELSPLTNRALNGLYAPGSTFKLGIAVAALEEGYITPSTIIDTKGEYVKYPGYSPKCWSYAPRYGYEIHGPINVSTAIQVSCNYFFYEIGDRMGIDIMNKYCRRYGIGSPTGIELGESVGILAGEEYRDINGLGSWYPGDTLAAAIGQSDNLLSPMQIAVYTSVLVNGGTRYQAHLLDSVRSYAESAKPIVSFKPNKLDELDFSEQTVETLRSAMRSVVTGSATVSVFMKNVPVKVGGKTGTAQVKTTASDNAVFTAAAPIDDPQIVVSAIIERGSSGGYVSKTVAEIMEEFFS